MYTCRRTALQAKVIILLSKTLVECIITPSAVKTAPGLSTVTFNYWTVNIFELENFFFLFFPYTQWFSTLVKTSGPTCRVQVHPIGHKMNRRGPEVANGRGEKVFLFEKSESKVT